MALTHAALVALPFSLQNVLHMHGDGLALCTELLVARVQRLAHLPAGHLAPGAPNSVSAPNSGLLVGSEQAGLVPACIQGIPRHP
jgi:hypothetical protein